jgi:hypothetical protein
VETRYAREKSEMRRMVRAKISGIDRRCVTVYLAQARSAMCPLKYLFGFVLLNVVGFAAEDRWQPLWNGKDLGGWTTWLRRPEPTSEVPGLAKGADGKYVEPLGLNRDPLKVFSVTTVDGKPVIRVSGEVFGELRSKSSFENYHLRLQFKWGEKKWAPRLEAPRDSGLLYHVHSAPGAEGRLWARSIELQIQEKDVGDLFSVSAMIFVRAKLRPGTGNATTRPIYQYNPDGPWHVFAQVPGTDGRCIKNPDNEKPTGEWNTVELVCFGEEAIHIVNGKVVMRLHSPTRIDTPTPQRVTSGPIILQSEGAELFYREIAWRPITAVPPEFAGK